jgi:hypothetical protein
MLEFDFTTDLPRPVADAEAVFIAVGTPSQRGDGNADLSYVHMAAREIAAAVSVLHRRRHEIDRAGPATRSNGSWWRPNPTPTYGQSGIPG